MEFLGEAFSDPKYEKFVEIDRFLATLKRVGEKMQDKRERLAKTTSLDNPLPKIIIFETEKEIAEHIQYQAQIG